MTYTQLVLVAIGITIALDLLALRTRVLFSKRYWIFFGIMSVFFFLVNGILTALPVVSYSSHVIIGLRLYTIPIEDAGYMFSLVTATIVIYERLSRTALRKLDHDT